MQNMSQRKNQKATFKQCSELIEKYIGLQNAAKALVVVDELTEGAWSDHINELGLKMTTYKFENSQIERDAVASWHFLKLKEFIRIYKKGLEQDSLL